MSSIKGFLVITATHLHFVPFDDDEEEQHEQQQQQQQQHHHQLDLNDDDIDDDEYYYADYDSKLHVASKRHGNRTQSHRHRR